MTVASEVFGPEHEQVTLYMSWKGRGETPAGIAGRLLQTMHILANLYPHGKAALCTLGRDGTGGPHRLPGDLEGLTALAAGKSNKNPDGTVREQGRTSIVALLLPDPEDAALKSDAMLSVLAGTPLGLNNKVSLQLEDNFPMGPPSRASHWFLDFVRIWQPQYALLKTTLTNSTDFGIGTGAAYLSWVSFKAFGPAPEVASAVRVPFGDGALYVAREWSLNGFAALGRDLSAAGCARILDAPKFQDPPAFPDGYPAGLDRLDDLVSWGSELDAELPR
ncbi:hypothetical protein NNX39_07435 [Arthrobacter sp. zg-Y826]|uniref:hypothetical protein n=1 Tax=Arthrobacter jinronghuae TaxID=2964609 RepID=UPI002103CE7D|nr:hypothetical protein [Arthrobacter jinronghuae]MCQ1956335.1 hypothetical protein [Arthrobacter jinronghuae]